MPASESTTTITHQVVASVGLARIQASNSQRYPHLLESVLHGGQQARYDILFAYPEQKLVAHQPGEFLDRLDDAWQSAAHETDRLQTHAIAEQNALDLPFTGGWFVYLSYEMAAEVEPILDLPDYPDAGDLPIALAVRHRIALVHDHVQGVTTLVAEPGVDQQQIDEVLNDIRAVEKGTDTDTLDNPPVLQAGLQQDDPQQYLDGIARIKDYILEGDVFQVNLSRQWSAVLRSDTNDADLYHRLCRANPAPFSALLHFSANEVLFSSSPERLVKTRGRTMSTRPIAGTRPRHAEADADLALSEELHAHPKERAEHVMLIDLERNDLGRVCEPGSVVVDELMSVESYAHVHHIVSNVKGRLRTGVTPAAVIRAVFPGGTITGCPKVRCMQIIAELEAVGRGPYTGALGYLNHNGDMDMNILIRSMLRRGREISFRAGAGIVHDSQADKELTETRNKALGLERSLQ